MRMARSPVKLANTVAWNRPTPSTPCPSGFFSAPPAPKVAEGVRLNHPHRPGRNTGQQIDDGIFREFQQRAGHLEVCLDPQNGG